MKRTILAFLAGTALLAGMCACVNRVKVSRSQVTRQVSVAEFTGIAVGNSVDVLYTQSTGDRIVEVHAPENLIDRITVEVKNGILCIGMADTDRHISDKGKCKVNVTAPAVNYLKASSSGDIKLMSGLTAEGNVSISAHSSGDVSGVAGVTCTGDLILTADSSGDIKIMTVRCNAVQAKASSSGDVKIGSLSCVDLSAYASSNGDVAVKALDAQNVKAEASSSGDVKLAGSCVNADLSASSSGEVKASGLKVDNLTKHESSFGSVACPSGK